MDRTQRACHSPADASGISDFSASGPPSRPEEIFSFSNHEPVAKHIELIRPNARLTWAYRELRYKRNKLQELDLQSEFKKSYQRMVSFTENRIAVTVEIIIYPPNRFETS